MSTGDPICERSDLPESMCAHCRGLGWEPVIDDLDGRDAPDRPSLVTFKAEFASTCPGCGEAIGPGQRIVRVGNRFVCGECADNENALEGL